MNNNNHTKNPKNNTTAKPPDKVNEPMPNVPAWLLEDDDEALDANNVADLLFDGTGLFNASENGSSMETIDKAFENESMSDYREQHSLNGRKKGPKRGSDNDNDNDNDMIDEMTKDTRFDKMYDFQAEDLRMSRILGGETIKTTKREKERLQQMETNVVDFSNINMDDGQAGATAAQMQQKYRNMMNYNDDDYAEMDIPTGDEEFRVHLNCKLCKHTSVRSSEMDPGFFDAYMCITELDRDKTMYATDAQIFKEMRILFNAQQLYIKDNGGDHFFVTTEDIKNHFLYHDTSNPLRGLNDLYRETKEIRRGARKHLFGKINERNMWNSQKTKVYLQLVKHEQALVNNITMMRHHMNMQDTSKIKGAASSAKNSTSNKTRHLTSAQNGGRYTSKYIN